MRGCKSRPTGGLGTKEARGGPGQYDTTAPTVEEARDGAVSCRKGSEDNSTSLMLLTIMSEDVIYIVDVMNISKVKVELVLR